MRPRIGWMVFGLLGLAPLPARCESSGDSQGPDRWGTCWDECWDGGRPFWGRRPGWRFLEAEDPERRPQALAALRRGIAGRVFVTNLVVEAGQRLLDAGEASDRRLVGAALQRLAASVSNVPTVTLAPMGRLLRELGDSASAELVRAELRRRKPPRPPR